MSDLAATHCGDRCDNGFSGAWILILLLFCCNGNNGLLGNGFGRDCDNGCNAIIWIILILCLCGNGF